MSTSTTGLSPRSVIELPITRALAELYVGNEVVPGLFEPFRIWGRCSRMADVARAVLPDGDGLFVLRLLAGWPGLFHAGRATAAVPEYWMELAEAPINTELWHLAKAGGSSGNGSGSGSGSGERDQKLAHFAGRHSGWQPLPAARERGLVPSAAAGTPAGGVPHGLFATYQGIAYPADFGPDAGELTAYQTATDGSVVPHRLADSQCDELDYRRTLATWRGVKFELLGERARIGDRGITEDQSPRLMSEADGILLSSATTTGRAHAGRYRQQRVQRLGARPVSESRRRIRAHADRGRPRRRGPAVLLHRGPEYPGRVRI